MSHRIPSEPLPCDLVIEILARLPVVSLFRLKSVCKSWYSHITSPSFVAKHLNQSITNTKTNGDKLLVRIYDRKTKRDKKGRYLLLNDDDRFGDEYSEFKFPFPDPFVYSAVVGSCNGLLCVVDDYYTDWPRIIVWNPSTRRSVSLPKAPTPQRQQKCVYGFGAHPGTREYAVIRIQYDKEYELKLPPKVEIYAQGTRSWRGIASAAPTYCMARCWWSDAFVGGAMHWVAYDPCVVDGYRCLIVSFDMATESFSEIILPPTLAQADPSSTSSLSIHVFGESLAVSCSGQRDGGGYCIWAMKEYGVAESWTKLFSSNLLGKPNKTLGFRKNGEVLLALDDSLASYAPGIETLAITGIKGFSPGFHVIPFMETLVSVENRNGVPDSQRRGSWILVMLVGQGTKMPAAFGFNDCEPLPCADPKLVIYTKEAARGKPAIIVWNPSIRKSVTLPDGPQVVPHMLVLGFGAHPTTREYKVVRIVHQKYPCEHEFQPLVELYTQGTESWRQLGSTFPPYCFIEYEASQAFVSGAVNWIATDPRVSPGYRPSIVSFDMRAETFSVLMLPPALADEKPASLSVKLFRESLVVLCDQQTGNNAYCIWVMKEYGVPESWTKLFSFKVNLPIVLDRALGVGENGKVLLSTRDELLLSSGDNRLLSYDTVTKAVTDTKIRGCSSGFSVEPFMETLVSVENRGDMLDRQLNPL
ncbi:hypothetical protein RHGRI_010084 [Rhododendron griersonianum]|uniref:F-box domain-containing protein n=1 Tax=Rhododendron griersonianum TaxID=479676 RepID=A0AAV6KH52_9ERIC|nr:hypothetical protein RHGRI_010084 [Rhododendron griersonianum]